MGPRTYWKMLQIIMAVAAIMSVSASDSTKTVCEGFLPQNSMKIPVGRQSGGITEAQYNAVMDRLEAIYAPIVAAQGGTLQINRLWGDPTVNSSAQRRDEIYILNMYGGLARHPAITQDGETLVACHEMSHHLGGAPKLVGWVGGPTWASNEGQADYAGTLKCMRRMFADPGTAGFTRMDAADPVAQKACSVFKNAKDQAICLRSATAGLSVTALFKAIHNEEKDPRFDTPDPTVVYQMDDDHPHTQCRLDTYFQGALCTQPVSAPLDEENPAPGACTRSQSFTIGMRPLCWYKPPGTEPTDDLRAAHGPVSLSKSEAFSSLNSEGFWEGL
ncbi:MAG: hypothetical protein NTX64_09240 [Elusimicrobia bacterium]|nr:hypothetical protein [Elusimicrobiota bacterium]